MQYSIYYDGDCPFCSRAARLLNSLDWLKRLELIDLHSPGVLARAGINPQRAMRRIQMKNANGEIREGMQAVVEIAGHVPLLWLLLPLLWLASLLGLGDQLYDWIAARRILFPTPGYCEWQNRH